MQKDGNFLFLEVFMSPDGFFPQETFLRFNRIHLFCLVTGGFLVWCQI